MESHQFIDQKCRKVILFNIILYRILYLYDEIWVIEIYIPKLQALIPYSCKEININICKTICQFLKNNIRITKTEELILQFKNKYLKSDVFKERIFYILFYNKLAKIFSR